MPVPGFDSYEEYLEALSVGQRQLARREPVTEEDWAVILEARARVLAPDLERNIKLWSLGGVRCLKGEKGGGSSSSQHKIEDDEPELVSSVDGVSSLKSKGLFVSRSRNLGTVIADDQETGCHHFWGLTRTARWVLVRVDFVCDHGYDRAVKVTVKETPLSEICAKTEEDGQQIAYQVFCLVRMWVDKRRTALDHAEKILQAFEREGLAMYMMRQAQKSDSE